jgi:hypothetical protein
MDSPLSRKMVSQLSGALQLDSNSKANEVQAGQSGTPSCPFLLRRTSKDVTLNHAG